MYRNLPPVTKNLLIINFIVWAAMAISPSLEASMERWCALYYLGSPGFRPWQLLSYMFLHANFTHLFFNMFALFMFGGIIEMTMGSKRFLVFYISCGLGAAFLQEGVTALMLSEYRTMFSGQDYSYIIREGWAALQRGQIFADPSAAALSSVANAPMLGASGAIYGILLAFGMLYPNRELFIMFIPVPVKAKWVVLGYVLLELALGISNNAGDNVAHFAHLGGMLMGFLLLLYWKKKGTFSRWY